MKLFLSLIIALGSSVLFVKINLKQHQKQKRHCTFQHPSFTPSPILPSSLTLMALLVVI